jgi:hypothetical protein
MLWKKLNYKVLKDQKTHSVLSDLGYSIIGNVGQEVLTELRKVHKQNHKFYTEDGGMFYSVYSLDISYRNRIYNELNKVLNPFYDTQFQEYKSVIHSFIIKVQGTKSEFTLHQDSTGLDEFQFSPISVWIPLQDTNISNGCLCVVPKSHRIKVPYRGISFNGPFHKISSTIRRFLKPIPMKAGDVLFFDNRLLHYSPANKSKEPRIVVMSGIFPTEAKILTCYKDETVANSQIEIFEQKDDFLLTGENFYHDCTIRPKTGVLIDEVKPLNSDLNEEEFLALAKSLDIEQVEISELQNLNLQMNIISEPLEKQIKPTWKKRFLSFLKKG